MHHPLPFDKCAIAQPIKHTTGSVWLRSLLASGLLIGGIAVAVGVHGGAGLPVLFHHGDAVTALEAQERLNTFNALAPLPLLPVQDEDIDNAINTMHLPADARDSLLSDLAKRAVNAPAPATRHVHLAWITLWDTDVEDGDVVRVDSMGYSRTVLLTKAPITFAVPVPIDGVVHVTGINDGDGGGITVGLASGASTAVFPIMSVDQSLGLKVRISQ
jgi:hypothetical protein